jgi:hypothetical protein
VGDRIIEPCVLHYNLPLSAPWIKKSPIVSNGITNLPKGVSIMNGAVEKLTITSLLTGLKDYYNINVDCDPANTRVPANSTQECADFLVIGGSHAMKTARELEKLGKKVQTFHVPNYRASSVHSGKIKEGLEKCTITKQTILVLQVFDNGYYMVSTEDGGFFPMHKGPDGVRHAIRELMMIPKEWQWRLYEQVEKDLEMLRKRQPHHDPGPVAALHGQAVLFHQGPHAWTQRGRV